MVKVQAVELYYVKQFMIKQSSAFTIFIIIRFMVKVRFLLENYKIKNQFFFLQFLIKRIHQINQIQLIVTIIVIMASFPIPH